MSGKGRSISQVDTSILITNAGGRCSYNFNGEVCNKVLSDGRVNLGERAHIVGVRGPRSGFPVQNLNGYDNLIWLCKDHHAIIDHSSNLDIFTVQVLQQMKYRHEQKIKTGMYPYYGTENSIHDYSALSTLFLFLDIHKLYGNIALYPKVHIDFYDVENMYEAYCEDNPPSLYLFDPILKTRFEAFLGSYYELANDIRVKPNFNEDRYTGWFEKTYDQESYKKVLTYLESVESLISIIGDRFPEILHQEVYSFGW
ncbi:hypothetical protein [Vibrio vulnificus]|uniref:hypothetical protein n=1 Tax=Vibrio vulnificus TaxID=672 RepID=UPI000CD28960|nr:hypothetical protein [Vibrio vulnificus]POB90039.1 hypothetical protein CRN40_01495 [Vibrio vulnificus]